MSEDNQAAAQNTPNAVAESPEQKVAEQIFDGNGVKQEPAKEEAKPDAAQEEKAESKADQYELKLPENSLLDEGIVADVVKFAQEKQLPAEVAQEILERENKVLSSYLEQHKKQYDAEVESWKDVCQKDGEIGGAEFVKSCEFAKRALDKFGGEDLKNILAESGYGNHPEVVRLLSRIGRAMDDDKIVLAGAQAAGKKSIEDIFYGNS